jgi:hypothetical protein
MLNVWVTSLLGAPCAHISRAANMQNKAGCYIVCVTDLRQDVLKVTQVLPDAM